MAFDQMRDGFIQEECDDTVDARLQCIKRNDSRDHHAHYHFQGCTHEQRGKDHIHHDHCQCLGNRTADQSDDRCFLCFVSFIDRTGNQYAEARCQNMHDDTDDTALGGYGHALNKGNHHCQDQTCGGAVGKGADQNRVP